MARHAVVFMHAYPSEQEGEATNSTRSTGQIEEGSLGFSWTIDRGVVSWRLKPIEETSVVMITSLGDERLIVDSSSPPVHGRGD